MSYSARLSCGNVFLSKKKKKKKSSEYIFVHGDPAIMLEGTTADLNSFILPGNVNEFDGYELSGIIYFVDKEKVTRQTSSQRDLEEENSTDDNGKATKTYAYNFTRDVYGYKYAASNDYQDDLSLNFTEKNGQLQLESVSRHREPVKMLHYSKGEKVFSFLFEIYEEKIGAKALVAFYFAKPTHEFAALPDADKEYDYIEGEGKRTVWSGAIKASLCEENAANKALLKDAVNSWVSNGKLEGMPFKLEEPKTYPPFSDVNANCIQSVPLYKYEDEENAKILGVTLPISQKSESAILAASVIIFEQAHEDFFQANPRHSLATARHEMGHFFGLGHEFDRDASGKLLHASIMGYNGEMDLTSWDRQAIKELYKDVPKVVDARSTATKICNFVENKPEARTTLDRIVSNLLSRSLFFGCKKRTAELIAGDHSHIDLAHSFIHNLDVLKFLPDVKYLKFQNTYVTDLTPLRDHPSLQEIELNDKVTDLTAIADNEALAVVTATDASKVKVCPETGRSPGVKAFCKKLKEKAAKSASTP